MAEDTTIILEVRTLTAHTEPDTTVDTILTTIMDFHTKQVMVMDLTINIIKVYK